MGFNDSCEEYSFFAHVEICLVLRIYVFGDRLLVLHFKKIMNGESENEGYKIYYCGQLEIIPEKAEINADETCRACGFVSGFHKED